MRALGPPTIYGEGAGWWGTGGRKERGGLGAYHDCYVVIVDAVVVYGGLEEVGVFFEPSRGLVEPPWDKSQIHTILAGSRDCPAF